MPQVSSIFSAARIMALEKRLLSRDDIKNLIDGDAMHVLQDRAYGGSAAGSDDAEKLIEGEAERTYALTKELAGDDELMQAFYLRNDAQNLKRFIKLRLMGREIKADGAQSGGMYEPALLALMVKSWEFPSLPNVFRQMLNELDEELAQSKNPQLISVYMDKAYYMYARSIKDEFASTYFGTECDFINLETLLRMRKYEPNAEYFAKLLMPEYKISVKQIKECLNGNIDARRLTLNFDERVRGHVIAALENENAEELQKLRDNTLLAIAREKKSDMQRVYPVVWYYIARQRESEIIRLCVTMRRSGFSAQDIEERLRELYG